MRIIRAAEHRQVPWKNGGGLTAEIAAFPEGASMDGFDWRLSMADVVSDGPFSIFSGIDRTLTLLSGAGMALDIEGRERIVLDSGSPPLAFPGDVAVRATLVDGPVRDLNVMTRRGRFSHRVEPFSVNGHREVGVETETGLLFCRHGEARIGGETVSKFDVARLERGAVAIEGDAAFCLVLLQRR
ncbi:HutD family protein [Rhizobiaceae bacterium BDR2-2]|uniref:HutD family protein n=1 Tax=Ectorhizobium quercum TaxID=2965071 RepID=A0AAE3N0U6_9HYPH|nr:HutD family protein [Ectorhizobium quercum]MCX8997230.1 HutD family protein [Ectorhizobium quercum]